MANPKIGQRHGGTAEQMPLMTADQIISDLMHALDVIKREAEKPEASRHYIIGAAELAMRECNRQRERNSDGYLVLKQAVR